jgi:hypothetical protein
MNVINLIYIFFICVKNIYNVYQNNYRWHRSFTNRPYKK